MGVVLSPIRISFQQFRHQQPHSSSGQSLKYRVSGHNAPFIIATNSNRYYRITD
jgi:hypothetical protein